MLSSLSGETTPPKQNNITLLVKEFERIRQKSGPIKPSVVLIKFCIYPNTPFANISHQLEFGFFDAINWILEHIVINLFAQLIFEI